MVTVSLTVWKYISPVWIWLIQFPEPPHVKTTSNERNNDFSPSHCLFLSHVDRLRYCRKRKKIGTTVCALFPSDSALAFGFCRGESGLRWNADKEWLFDGVFPVARYSRTLLRTFMYVWLSQLMCVKMWVTVHHAEDAISQRKCWLGCILLFRGCSYCCYTVLLLYFHCPGTVSLTGCALCCRLNLFRQTMISLKNNWQPWKVQHFLPPFCLEKKFFLAFLSFVLSYSFPIRKCKSRFDNWAKTNQIYQKILIRSSEMFHQNQKPKTRTKNRRRRKLT